MKFLKSPYEETIRWFKKITGSARSSRHRKLGADADMFDWIETVGVNYIFAVVVLISAAMLETLMLPAALASKFVSKVWKSRGVEQGAGKAGGIFSLVVRVLLWILAAAITGGILFAMVMYIISFHK